mmetsp:Transcript_68427/g.160479  ORF Transcript_68427/g.160479 Transcript_68427/m.160479 type:complete len:223 (-) Transcript_68427:631-1299(-)
MAMSWEYGLAQQWLTITVGFPTYFGDTADSVRTEDWSSSPLYNPSQAEHLASSVSGLRSSTHRSLVVSPRPRLVSKMFLASRMSPKPVATVSRTPRSHTAAGEWSWPSLASMETPCFTTLARACAWSGTGETVVLRICWMFKHSSTASSTKVKMAREVRTRLTYKKLEKFLANACVAGINAKNASATPIKMKIAMPSCVKRSRCVKCLGMLAGSLPRSFRTP